MGGGTKEQCGSNKAFTGSTFLGSLKNLTIGLIWLVTRGGGVGGPGRRARGGRWGGAPESSVKATTGSTFWAPLKTLAGDEGGRRGGCGPGRRARGGRWGGGHQRAVWEQQDVHWFHVKT